MLVLRPYYHNLIRHDTVEIAADIRSVASTSSMRPLCVRHYVNDRQDHGAGVPAYGLAGGQLHALARGDNERVNQSLDNFTEPPLAPMRPRPPDR